MFEGWFRGVLVLEFLTGFLFMMCYIGWGLCVGVYLFRVLCVRLGLLVVVDYACD